MGLTLKHRGALSTLRLGSWEVRLLGPRSIVHPLGAVLSSVVLPEPGMPSLDVVISDTDARGALAGQEVWTLALPKRGRLPLLVGQVAGTATSVLRQMLFVHAAVVALAGRGYVLVGAPGAGKTSTAAALLREGARYLSDEIAILDPSTGLLHPVALPLAVKPWTAKAAGRLPPLREVAADAGVRYLAPAGATSGPVPLEAVVLLDPQEPPARVTDVPRAEMLFTLSQHASSFRYREQMPAAFRGFVRLLRAVRCVRVGTAAPQRAAAVIASFAGELQAV